MLPRTLFTRSLLPTTLPGLFSTTALLRLPPLARASSTTLSDPAAKMSYTLPPHLFNTSLYTSLQTLWFADLSPTAKTAPLSTTQRWFSFGLSQDEKDAFDSRCRDISGAALEALGPDRVILPPQAGDYEGEVEQAGDIAGPLIKEVEAAGGEGERADRLLSLILLLDQMPRNTFRTRATLPLVYRHYDRLALSLIALATRLSPSPLLYKPYLARPVVYTWLLMPFTHSESLAAHETGEEYAARMERIVREEGDEGAATYLGRRKEAEDEHVEVLRRFGRYPQRNQGLGRLSTEEERMWLAGGGGFGVVQEEEGGGQDGQKGVGKDEL